MASFEKRFRVDGKPSWRAVVRVKTDQGLVTRKKQFRRKTDAKEWARKTEDAIREGRDSAGRSLLVRDLIEGYRLELLPKINSAKDRRGRERLLDWWDERVGRVEAERLQPKTVLRHLRELKKGKGLSGGSVSDTTRNRYKSALGACYRHAVKQGLIRHGSVPTAGLHLSEKGNERDRWLSEGEKRRLLEVVAGTGRLELVVLIGMATGARKGEVMGIKWRDVDLEKGVIRLEKTKTKKKRIVPILPKALQILTEWLPRKNSDDDLIFVGPRGGHSFPREAWDRALKQAEIEDFTFHGLRHTAASWMIQEGIQETKAQELLGHESIVTMRRYTHLVQERNAEELREAMLKRGAEG